VTSDARPEVLAAASAEGAGFVAAVQRRTVGGLSGAQVLGGLGVGAGVAVGGLIAASLANSDSAGRPGADREHPGRRGGRRPGCPG